MIILCFAMFLGALLHANHHSDPMALVRVGSEFLEVSRSKNCISNSVAQAKRDLDVIGVCAAGTHYANYRENPDALVVHNVVLGGVFTAHKPVLFVDKGSSYELTSVSECELDVFGGLAQAMRSEEQLVSV